MSSGEKRSLYKIADELERALAAAIDSETGEVLDEGAADKLEQLDLDIRTKVLGVGAFLKGLRHEAELTGAIGKVIKTTIEAQAKSHLDRAAKLTRQAEYWVGYIDRCLGIADMTPGPTDNFEEIHDERSWINYTKSSSVEVLRPELVPEEMLLPPKPREPSKILLRDAIKLRGGDEYIIHEKTSYAEVEDVVVARIVRKQTLKVG